MSDIQFPCPHCGSQIVCGAENAGQAANCPSCQKSLVIPANAPPPPPPPKPALPPLPGQAVAKTPPPVPGAAAVKPPPPVPGPAVAKPPTPPPPASPTSPRIQSVGPARKTPGVAVAALVLSLLGIALGGIICGHIARGRIRRDPSLGGKGLATAGLIIGYVTIIVPLLGLAALLAFAPSVLDKFKDGMASAASTNEVAAGERGVTTTKETTPPKSGSTRKSGTSKSTQAKSAQTDTPEEAVRKVVQAYLDAEMKQDIEAMKSLLTTKAQKNFTAMIPMIPAAPGSMTLRLEKATVDGEKAQGLVRMSARALGTTELGAFYRLKPEEGQWRIYAISILIDNDEPGVTVDLEKGMQPIIEADPAKLTAYFAKLNPAAKTTKKSGKTTTTRPPTKTTQPTPTTTTEEPKPVVKEPEPVTELVFENRRSPASVDFTAFVGTTGVKAQVANYSNKAIRRINVSMFYLDSGSSAVGKQSASLLNNDPNIVARSAKAEVEFKATVPADARKAIIELEELPFMDGTTWRPGQK